MSWGMVAGAAVGVVGSAMTSDGGGGGGSTATSKEPWAEAAPWIKDNITAGQNLQNYYQKTPFNQQQQTGYQNLFGDLDNFRGNTAPGMMDFANKLMGSNYQRAAAGTELGAANPYADRGMLPAMLQKQAYQASQGMPVGQQVTQGQQQGGQGLLGGIGSAQQGGMQGLLNGQQTGPNGLPVSWNGTGAVPLDGQVSRTSMLADPMYGRPTGASTPSAGAFQMPQGQSYGLLDFQAMNPYNNELKPSDKPDQPTMEQMIADEIARQEAIRQAQLNVDMNPGGA